MCAGALLYSRRLLCARDSSPLTWVAQPAVPAGSERRYRTDAQVVVFSVPLLHRKGVGDGSAVWTDSATGNGALRLLEFTGRSNPERAAGLNRFGFIQELSRTSRGAGAESIYFGLMTSSPEESVAEARKALRSNPSESPYSAIEGRIAGSSIETAGIGFIARTPHSAAEQNELIDRARHALREAPRNKVEFPSGAAPPPFLQALAGLLNDPGAAETRYAYNGRIYRLRLQRSPDPKAAAAYRELHLIPAAAAVARVSGSLWPEDGGKPIEFRLWIEEGVPRPIPLRIDYQPKSYLRLTFEALA